MANFLGIPAWVWLVAALLLIGGATLLLRRRRSADAEHAGFEQEPPSRLTVLESAPIDAERRLVLVRCDAIEHLILVGGPADVVVDSDVRRHVQDRRSAPIPFAPQAQPRPTPDRSPRGSEMAPGVDERPKAPAAKPMELKVTEPKWSEAPRQASRPSLVAAPSAQSTAHPAGGKPAARMEPVPEVKPAEQALSRMQAIMPKAEPPALAPGAPVAPAAPAIHSEPLPAPILRDASLPTAPASEAAAPAPAGQAVPLIAPAGPLGDVESELLRVLNSVPETPRPPPAVAPVPATPAAATPVATAPVQSALESPAPVPSTPAAPAPLASDAKATTLGDLAERLDAALAREVAGAQSGAAPDLDAFAFDRTRSEAPSQPVPGENREAVLSADNKIEPRVEIPAPEPRRAQIDRKDDAPVIMLDSRRRDSAGDPLDDEMARLLGELTGETSRR
jgi:flagellar protein FliO/FliZ